MAITVKEIKEDLTQFEKKIIDAWKRLGYPVSYETPTFHRCQDRPSLEGIVWQDGDDKDWFEYATVPIKYRAFCNHALNLKSKFLGLIGLIYVSNF